jgi:hypothetical protein
MVAGIYVICRLMEDGGDWLGFALVAAAILTVVFVALPGDERPHDPATEITYLSVQMTAWWIFGFIHRWSGAGFDWLLYWLVALAILVERLEVRRWEPPPEG